VGCVDRLGIQSNDLGNAVWVRVRVRLFTNPGHTLLFGCCNSVATRGVALVTLSTRASAYLYNRLDYSCPTIASATLCVLLNEPMEAPKRMATDSCPTGT
jgi:hypothetical protein